VLRVTRKERKARTKSKWVRPELFRGGVFVGKVVSFDAKHDTANLYLHYAGRDFHGRETPGVPVAEINGSRRTGPAPREMTEAEVRAELVARCDPNSVLYRDHLKTEATTTTATTEGSEDDGRAA
jgi:hypothetical protein